MLQAFASKAQMTRTVSSFAVAINMVHECPANLFTSFNMFNRPEVGRIVSARASLFRGKLQLPRRKSRTVSSFAVATNMFMNVLPV